MIAEIYKSITDMLLEKVPGLKWIDLYRGQYRNFEKEYPFSFPAVFIEFVELPFVNDGNNTSSAPSTIKIHIVQDNTADTFRSDLKQNNTPGLIYLETVDAIHKALQGFAPTNCSRLQGATLISDTEDSSMIVYLRDYRCQVYDFSTANNADYVEVELTAITPVGDINND